MERLDIYDENMTLIGSEDREVVHEKGLWHKTVHCWLYDRAGNIYFQIREGSGKLYTTASGHVLAGETLKEAFHREVQEEIGVSVDISNAQLVEVTAWRMDKVKNGKPFKDRAYASVYINEIDDKFQNFKFDPNEVLGVVKVNAKKCLDLLDRKVTSVQAERITDKREKIMLRLEDFLVQQDEIAIIKYGKILQSVIHATNQ